MTKYMILAATILLAGTATCAAACASIQSQDRERLTRYIVEKFGIPDSVKISIKSDQVVGESCYRKLVLSGQGPLGEFSNTLFLAPDMRFLSSELMDTTLDPAEERLKAAQKVMNDVQNGDSPFSGPADASVTLVMFSDVECPYCKQAAAMLRSEPLITDGKKVKLIYRHFPLGQHPWAQKAAEATSCAALQGSGPFWGLHDLLFAKQAQIQIEGADQTIKDLANSVPSINQAQFDGCLQKQLSLGLVLRDKEVGERVGVNATPTFFLNGDKVAFSSVEDLHALLQARLSRQKPGQSDEHVQQSKLTSSSTVKTF